MLLKKTKLRQASDDSIVECKKYSYLTQFVAASRKLSSYLRRPVFFKEAQVQLVMLDEPEEYEVLQSAPDETPKV